MTTITQLGPEYRNYCVSSGTMRDEDIIAAVSEFLPEDMEQEARQLLERASELEDRPWDDDDRVHAQDMLAYMVNETIWDYMSSIAPDGCYFGAIEGDGACYGFWTGDESDED